MNKKYTMEEFKELFDKAKELAEKEIERDINKCFEEDPTRNEIDRMLFIMENKLQSMLAFYHLRKNLFGKEK